MIHAHSHLWHYLWLAPPVLLAVIVAVMVRRKLCRAYPAFLAYALWQVMLTPLLFVFDHASSVTATQYQYAQWVKTIGSILLRFAVIHEIISILFRPYRALRQLGSIVFGAGLVILLLVAVAVAQYAPSAGYADRIVGSLFLLERAVAIVQCGLLLALLLFSSYFKLSWGSYVYGIAIGLGISSSVQIAITALAAQAPQGEGLNFILMGTYHACVVVWALYLLAPEPAVRSVQSVPDVNLESWNEELRRFLRQ